MLKNNNKNHKNNHRSTYIKIINVTSGPQVSKRIRSTFSLTGPLTFGTVYIPNHVVLSDTGHTFKSKLDKFWQLQPIIYDFKAEILGTGSRSWY